MANVALMLFGFGFFLFVLWMITADYRDNRIHQQKMKEQHQAFRQRMAERKAKYNTPNQ